MNENHDEAKPQMNADKRRCGLDAFSFPGGEILSADTLGKSSDLTPLHARKDAKMLGNSPGLTPLRFDCEIFRNNESDSVDKRFSAHGTDTQKNSSRLAPLRPFDKFAKRGDLDER